MELERFERYMRLRNYSSRTRKTYLYHVRHFLRWVKKSPVDASRLDVENWLLFL